MKKQIVFKIVLSMILLLGIIGSFWLMITYIDLFHERLETFGFQRVWKYCKAEINVLIVSILSLTINTFFLIYINLKDVKILTASLIEKVKEYRASTAEKRKADKQAKLTQEIAERQAELEELSKKTPKRISKMKMTGFCPSFFYSYKIV